jgi:hypothetical protein
MNKTIECALGISALLALAGCYNTNSVKNGGLVCGTGGTCPSGYLCKSDGPVGSAGHCWKNGIIPDASVTTKADADPGLACSTSDGTYGPFATCSASRTNPNSTCDPICQAGCPCKHRCILDENTSNSFTCEASPPPVDTSFVQPLGSCNGTNVGLCAPGSACIGDDRCPNLCYRLCRTDDDCSDKSRCTASGIVDPNTKETVANVNFCSPPIEACNPTGSASCGTARANFNCVFLAGLTGIANNDLTVCDCSTLHDKPVGQKCSTLPDDCLPGSVCVAISTSTSTNPTCHTVCSLKSSGSACPNGGGCNPLYGSQTYGYCR